MNKPKIKMVEFYLKNFAPFYESMGLREFHIDKRDSPYNLTLIVGSNGSGKSFLITEISPQTIEHIVGRIANRFIEGEDGEKRIHFIVNDTYEYICTILYDKTHKTTCFLKRIELSTGKEEELNPNGNVTSFQELCEMHLYYNKTFKNVGYITDNVKNVITMSYTERQQLFSTWLPDTSQFLSATKMITKKINITKKEIENLVADITKISISTYKENLENLKLNLNTIEKDLLFYRDHISKINLLIGSFSKYEHGLLKEHISQFKEKVKRYNERLRKSKDTFKKYGKYLSNEGEKRLFQDISSLREQKVKIEGNLNNINDKIAMIQNAIGRIKSTNEISSTNPSDLTNIVSVNEAISTINVSMEQLDIKIADSLNANSIYEDITYSDELKDSIKQLLVLFPSLYQMSLGIIQSCDNFTLKEIFEKDSLFVNGLSQTIKALHEQNSILENSIKSLHDHEKEMSKLSVDESFIAFIPSGCNETSCTLVKELRKHLNQNSFDIQKEIDSKTITFTQNKEKLDGSEQRLNTILKIINDVNAINNLVYEQKEKIAILPEYLFQKINSNKIDEFIQSLNTIIIDLQGLDEYVSLLEKRDANIKSVKNLLNIYNLLKQSDTLNSDLANYLENEKVLYKERDDISVKLNELNLRIHHLSNLNDTISSSIEEKKILDEEYNALCAEQKKLNQENQNLYYKVILQKGLSVFKVKENDLSKNEVMVKSEIEKCTSSITNRSVLEQRKNAFEEKLRIYELLYAVWNPRTGYPSMLIKEFLDEVLFVTNTSLDTIWGGLIRIKEFRLGENEFSIPIIRGNTVLLDICECSTAEKNTLALTISLAIVQVSTSYNIIRLDEVDDGFDEIRRQSFLEMITLQLISAGCEDCYAITHNQYFENIPCNIILLKGYDLLVSEAALENKHILYKYPTL